MESSLSEPADAPAVRRLPSVAPASSSSDRKLIGDLKIYEAGPAAAPKRASTHQVVMVRRNAHVSYDSKSKRYLGLPAEWEKELKKQFGLPPTLVEKEEVEGYQAPIPSILIFMKQYLFVNGGLETQGIFRLAPDADECSRVKAALDVGKFSKTTDINVMSNRIKVWFRDLPHPILGVVNSEAITLCATGEQAVQLLDAFPEPNRSIMFWLIDMCVEVAENCDTNKMPPKNLAIVIAPNLFRPQSVAQLSPGEALEEIRRCKAVTDFLERAIDCKLQLKARSLVVSPALPSSVDSSSSPRISAKDSKAQENGAGKDVGESRVPEKSPKNSDSQITVQDGIVDQLGVAKNR